MGKFNFNRRAAKEVKSNKKQPIKMVYISNPVKVVTSATNFRAVVQELTGQDSDITYLFDSSSASSTVDSSGKLVTGVDLAVAANETTADFNKPMLLPTTADVLDDAFTSPMLEDFWWIQQ